MCSSIVDLKMHTHNYTVRHVAFGSSFGLRTGVTDGRTGRSRRNPQHQLPGAGTPSPLKTLAILGSFSTPAWCPQQARRVTQTLSRGKEAAFSHWILFQQLPSNAEWHCVPR